MRHAIVLVLVLAGAARAQVPIVDPGLLLLGVESSKVLAAAAQPRQGYPPGAMLPVDVALAMLIEEIDSLWVDGATIMDILARAEDRKALAAAYKKKTGVDLHDAIRRHMSGHDERVALAMLDSDRPVLTETQMDRQFRDAVAAYEKAHGKLKDSSRVAESAALLGYLSQHSNVVDSKTVAKFTTGQEYALREKIRATSEGLGRPLSPGEVFGLALELNGGDKFKAVLTAHNMLRAQARGRNDPLQAQVPADRKRHGRNGDAFGIMGDDAWMAKYLQPIRGGSDEGGAWYHFFGMAAFSMTSGRWTAKGASQIEERYVSGDAKSDPLELYIDSRGAEAGSIISAA